MPSILQPWCRDYPYDARVKNLAKALSSPRYHPPRPWRSKDEAYMIRRYAFWWWTCRDSNKPSGRSWARQLGVSHTWLQKLVREFQRNPDEMWRHVQQTTMSVHLPRLGGFLEDLAAGVLPLHLHRNNDRKTPARFRIVPTWKVTSKWPGRTPPTDDCHLVEHLYGRDSESLLDYSGDLLSEVVGGA